MSIIHSQSYTDDTGELHDYPYTQKISSTKLIVGALALFLALNAGDCFLTTTLVRNGAGWEGNYIWSYVPVWYKMILATVIGIVVASYRAKLLLILNVGMLAIILWNLIVWSYHVLS